MESSSKTDDSAAAIENGNEVFCRARDDFLSKLSDEDRSLYSSYKTSADFISEMGKLDILRRRHSESSKWMQRISSLASCLRPYFQVIDIFVSSHPEFAALVWGALRLVFQLAGNFGTFFDKLTELFGRLVESFPQYDMILTICNNLEHNQWADNDESTSLNKLRKAHRKKIQHNVEAVYHDLFQIIHAVIHVFTKSDGRLKKTPVVIRQLIWKPFDLRFGDLIKRIEDHRRSLFQDVLLLMVSESIMRERVPLAAHYEHVTRARQLNDIEVRQAAKEKTLVQERERLSCTQSEASGKALEHVKSQLEDIQGKLDKLEHDRLQRSYLNVRLWLSPSNYTDPRSRASRSRQSGTANWIFNKPFYIHWRDQESPLPPDRYKFGSGVLWIYGHPGSGKTTLASALLDDFDKQAASAHQMRPDVFYFFFEELSSHSSSPIHAYRAILAQMLKKRKSHETMLDRFAFIMDSSNQGDPASETALIDLLQLCLESHSILVIDGVDECRDNDSLIEVLLEISKKVASLQIIFLSRVNVTALQRTVSRPFQHKLAKDELEDDISLFCRFHLGQLFDQRLLPDSARSNLESMIERMVTCADGMFLWARLMINYLRSCVLTPRLRLAAIDRVRFPEGLEKMYERIFLLITSAGQSSSAMASRVLTWSAYSLVPMTSYQVRQALVAEGHLPVESCSDDITEFEESAIMVCAGLVEGHKSRISDLYVPTSVILRLIHSSAREILDKLSQSLLSSRSSPLSVSLLPDPIEVNLYLANTCLRQLLYYTPAQPLSGKLNQGLSAGELAANLPFTDHSGVCWMYYLSAGIRHIGSIRRSEPRCLFEDDALETVTNTLWSFLQKPVVLSTWLESFYTAKEFRRVLGYEHPPTHLLGNWPTSDEKSTSQPISASRNLREELNSFCAAVKEVVDLWGYRLEEAPEIIWDEMNGFIRSRFFSDSVGTRATVQNPDPPPLANLSTKPIAVLSRTTRDGHLKGVLSIWPPRVIHDVKYVRSILCFEETDLSRLCTGWVAAYDIWTLQDQPRKVTRIQVPIDRQDILFDIRRCLGQSSMKEIDLAITIAPDALSFSVLRTVFVVHPQPGEDCQPNVLIGKLPMRWQAGDFTWNINALMSSRMYSYSVHACAVGRYIILVERDEPGQYILTTYHYTLEETVHINKVSCLNLGLSSGFSHVAFHPTLSLMVFSFIRGTMKLVMWMFNTKIVVQSHCEVPIKTVHFSECGSYLVVQPPNVTGFSAQPYVLAVPASFLNNPSAKIDLDTPEQSLGLDPAPFKSTGSLPPIEQIFKSLTHAAHVGSDGSTTTISVAAPRGNIELSSDRNSESLSTKLVIMPPWSGLQDMSYSMTPPSTAGQPLRISVDMPPRVSFPLRVPDSQAPVMLIERDMRVVRIPHTLQSIVLPLPRVQTLHGSSTLDRKRRLEQTDWNEDGETDRASHRVGHSPPHGLS